MTQQELDELAQRWYDPTDGYSYNGNGVTTASHNAFVKRACIDVTTLVLEVKRLRAEVERLEQQRQDDVYEAWSNDRN